ncbi:hypothetical protein [Halorussus pelagicus]|uniref:hypothetical protein n=1 Tax=Halorussus pelagicus TaxID=2505977 RepID=UPI000FFBD8C1|nr:hypothetical protein [Halorussus pelagicus]
MLDELVQRTTDEFGIRLRNCDPVRHEVPKLIGIRHCIHHRGLVGVNIVETELSTKPAVCMYLESLRKHGNWGGNQPGFQTFFHGSKRDVLALRPVIENSESKCDTIVTELIERLEEKYGENELRKRTANVELYL